MRRLFSVAAGAVILSASSLASADPTYKIEPTIDLPALAIAGTLAASWLLSPLVDPPDCAPQCDRWQLLPIDRPFAGNYSTEWKAASDASIAAVLIGSVVIVGVDEGLRDGLNDIVVVGQAMLFANALSVLTNYATRRPRPFLYGESAPLEDRMLGNAGLSFFSGHTANAFALTISTFETLRRKDPNRPLPWVQLGVGLSLSTFIGVARVAAGDHFPTDVISGAIVGTSFGFLMPALHAKPVRVLPGPGGTAGITVIGAL